MKIIKLFLIFVISILLFISLLLFQINVLLKYTVLSSHHFNETFDHANIASNLTGYLFGKVDKFDLRQQMSSDGEQEELNIQSSERIERMNAQVKDTFYKYVDRQWVENQISIVIKGVFGYFVNEEDELPTIDISPVKDTLPGILADQIILNTDKNGNTELIKKIIKIVNEKRADAERLNISKEDIIDNIHKTADIASLGLDKDIIEAIIDKIETKEYSDSEIDDLHYDLVVETMRSKLKADSINSKLETDVIVEKVFLNAQNPLVEIKKLIDILKDKLFAVLLVLIFGLLLIIGLAAYSPKVLSRAAGVTFVLSGLLSVFICKLSQNYVGNLMVDLNIPEGEFLIGFVETLLKSIISSFTSFGIVLIILGIALIVLSFIIGPILKSMANMRQGTSITGEKEDVKDASKIVNRLIRISVIIITIGIMFFSVRSFSYHLISSFNNFKDSVEKSSEVFKNNKIAEIITEETGIEFLKEFSDKEK